MQRYLESYVIEDLNRKLVFFGGPRQVGKTTLSLNIAPDGHRYLNWDDLEDREFILREKFPECDAIQVHHFDPQEFISKDGIRVINWRRLLLDYGNQITHTNSLRFS